MTSSPDIRAAVRCPPLTDCWTRRAFVLHPRVPVCVCLCVWQYTVAVDVHAGHPCHNFYSYMYKLQHHNISKSYIDALVIRAIFAPKAPQPPPDLRGQGQGPLSALASSDGGRPTRSWKRGHTMGSLRWESDFQSLSNTTKKQGGF